MELYLKSPIRLHLYFQAAESGKGMAKNCTLRGFVICTLHECYYNNRIKRDKMGGSCSMNEKF